MKSHENRISRFAHSGVLQGVGGGVLSTFFCILLWATDKLGNAKLWMVVPPFAAVGFLFFRWFSRALMAGSGKLAGQILMPEAKGTYAPQQSLIQSLEVQEKYAEALGLWMQVIEAQPGNPSPLLRAADLQLRHLGNAPAALELYERVRRMPGINAEHVKYASQKIIDIHLAPGGDEGRALVELRRFVTTFPDGREAVGAREALARLKGLVGDG